MIESSPSKVAVGIIGCGKISDAYFAGCARYDILKIQACADLDIERAQAKAAQHAVIGCSVADLLADPGIRIVLNLTVPSSHVRVSRAILEAGKHLYSEKPFALIAQEARGLLALSRKRGLLAACAPDTLLGGGFQTARKLIDDGAIGKPLFALAFMLSSGVESWHPNPVFYYAKGGGPVFDMGPYYLSALVNLFGPAVRVTSSGKASHPERLVTSQPLAGLKIPVEVPTHQSGTIDFSDGTVATLVMSFDALPGSPLPRIMVYGSEGTLEVPDPNTFVGPVRIRRRGEMESTEVPLTHTDDRARGSGVADLAYSVLRPGRPGRCNADVATHVVEIMQSFEAASVTGRHLKIKSTCERPPPLPLGLGPSGLDP